MLIKLFLLILTVSLATSASKANIKKDPLKIDFTITSTLLRKGEPQYTFFPFNPSYYLI